MRAARAVDVEQEERRVGERRVRHGAGRHRPYQRGAQLLDGLHVRVVRLQAGLLRGEDERIRAGARQADVDDGVPHRRGRLARQLGGEAPGRRCERTRARVERCEARAPVGLADAHVSAGAHATRRVSQHSDRAVYASTEHIHARGHGAF